MPTTKNYYPPVGFYFQVKFQGGNINSEASFKEVSGLSVNISPDEIKEGGNTRFVHKLPATPKYSNLVLKRGLLKDSALRKWIEKGINEFEFTPITVLVQLLNDKGDPTMAWKCTNVWPVKWDISNFNSMNNELVVESIELAYDAFETMKMS